MRRCSRCVLPETYPNTSFDEQGVCNHCVNHQDPVPIAQEVLLRHLERAKKKSRRYDALVPLSGGKDSTYVLYLATKVYGLSVLAYTFDNGFLSSIALANIESALRRTGVDHLFFKPNWDTMKRLYRSTLLKSGELCSVCGIGMMHGYLKASADWQVPLILIGNSAMERGSWSPEKIYNVNRFKAIVADAGEVSEQEINRFLIYPNLNPGHRLLYTMLGRFGRVISPLQFGARDTEAGLAKLLSREMGWQDGGKHSDCWAEPFSNLIRGLRYGYSRKAIQLSNLVRSGEMTRETALTLLSRADREETTSREMVLDKLELSVSDLDVIGRIPPRQYDQFARPDGLTRIADLARQLATRARPRAAS